MNEINEKDFNYINELWTCCNDNLEILLNKLIQKNYKYIDDEYFTQYDYNSFMRLIFYIIKIKLFNNSVYNENQLKAIRKCYIEMTKKFNEYKIEKIFNLNKDMINDLFNAIDIIDSYSYMCDGIFMNGDKTLNSFIVAPCMITHYYRKNGEKNIVKLGDNIIPDDKSEYEKLYVCIIEMISNNHLYDDVIKITNKYFGILK